MVPVLIRALGTDLVILVIHCLIEGSKCTSNIWQYLVTFDLATCRLFWREKVGREDITLRNSTTHLVDNVQTADTQDSVQTHR